MEFGKRIGKVPVLAGNCDGFIGNRMAKNYLTEAKKLMYEGNTPATIDKSATQFGMPMGPNTMADMSGLQIGYITRKDVLKRGHPDEVAAVNAFGPYDVQDYLIENKRTGQNTGRG